MPVDEAVETALATRHDLRAALAAIEAARQDELTIDVSGLDDFDIRDFSSDLEDADRLRVLRAECDVADVDVAASHRHQAEVLLADRLAGRGELRPVAGHRRREVEFAVVGAGVMGLAAAWALAGRLFGSFSSSRRMRSDTSRGKSAFSSCGGRGAGW